ncbi:MAG: hypothetical protein AB7U85_06515 [Alphaproteobacteria bacterium]
MMPPPLPKFENEKQLQEPNNESEVKNNDFKLSKAKPLARGISLLVGVFYLNEYNELEKKRITIRRLWQQNDEVLIDAFCHETQAPRIFLLSRIQKIVDLKNKRAFSNPEAFIFSQIKTSEDDNSPKTASYTNTNSPTAEVIRNLTDELTCLVFLAQTDNEFSPIEKKVITDYVIKRGESVELNPDEISDYINRIYPDEDSFYDALDDLLNKSEQVLTDFVETFIKLILSDGVIHDNEREFLSELLLVLKEEGIEIKTNI